MKRALELQLVTLLYAPAFKVNHIWPVDSGRVGMRVAQSGAASTTEGKERYENEN